MGITIVGTEHRPHLAVFIDTLFFQQYIYVCRPLPFINCPPRAGITYTILWCWRVKMSKKDSKSSSQSLGECGYCGKSISADKNKALPLECQKCSELYHVSCMKGEKPSVLLGDQLWLFRCAFCSPLGQETCTRPNLQWWVTQSYVWTSNIPHHVPSPECVKCVWKLYDFAPDHEC